MDVKEHPEYKKIEAGVESMLAHLAALEARAKDAYWAASARQHLLNFSFAYRKAFHDLPPAEKVVVEDLY